VQTLYLLTNIEPLSRDIVSFGPFTITWYAFLILAGAFVAYLLAASEAKKLGIDRNFIDDLVLFGLPIAIVGARIYYVVFEWGSYKDDPIRIFFIQEGGLAIYGAVIAALIWGYFLAKARKVDFLKVIDVAAVGFLIAQAIGRWGNFMNQEAHGGPVTRAFLEKLRLPEFIINQMYIRGTYYHPTFLYESVWNLIGFGILLVLRRTKLFFVGDLGLLYLIWYGLGRAWIEGMRTDSLYIGDIRVSQLVSVLMVIGGATVLILRHVKKWNAKPYHELLSENRSE